MLHSRAAAGAAGAAEEQQHQQQQDAAAVSATAQHYAAAAGSRYHQQQQQFTSPLPPLPQQQHQQHSSSCQLRPPPARYSSNTSNLQAAAAAMHRGPHHHQHIAACDSHNKSWPPGGGPGGGLGGGSRSSSRSRGHHHHSHHDEATCTCVLPRTSVLCRLLVAMIVLLVLVQAVSCGMFFCVTLPGGGHSRGSYVDYQELVADISAPSLSLSSSPLQQQQQQPLAAVPKLIPRVIHQTYRSGRLPAPAKAFMRTWAEVNGDSWQVRFYSDDAALAFVRREFPEYFEAYLNLPRDVERADFFRYMVVLRLGGAYADVDAECRQPLDSIIEPADTLLVGWDTEVANATSAAASGLARQRVVANWFFVAAAGHPVLRELCDHIARNAMSTFSSNAVRDTAERTGQGVWTDVLLRHALRHQAAKHDDPWKVRILPRVAFGVRPLGGDADAAGLRPDTPGVVVLHHFAASWKAERHRRLMQALLSWGGRSASQLQAISEPVLPSNVTHFPVSIAFSPPFTLMTDLVGSGDTQAAADVSAMITAHGTWQPGVAPFRKPAVVEALVGALAKHRHRSSDSTAATSSSTSSGSAEPAAAAGGQSPSGVPQQASSAAASPAAGGAAAPSAAAAAVNAEAEQAGRAAAAAADSPGSSTSTIPASPAAAAAAASQPHGGVLVDVGAGQGFFSLAAAARGHRVVAFESSPASLAALKASIQYNGFQGLITVHSTALGAAAGAVCLQHAEQHGCARIAAAAAGVTLAPSRPQHVMHGSNASVAVHNTGSSSSSGSRGGGNSTAQQQQQREAQQQRAAAVVQAQLRRRRGYPWLADGAALSPADSCCALRGSRLRLSDVLANVTDVAALRVSAHGHEGFILQGGLEYLRNRANRPEVVYVEFWPAAMRAAGDSQPVALLQSLYDAGYTDIAHAGRVCDARWHNATQSLHLQGTYSAGSRLALQQPTWCKLRPEQFSMLADTADANVPENVMFLLAAASTTAHSAAADNAAAAGSSSSSSSGGTAPSSSSSVESSNYAGAAAGAPKQDAAPLLAPAVTAQGEQDQGPLPPPASLAIPCSLVSSSSSNWQPQQPL